MSEIHPILFQIAERIRSHRMAKRWSIRTLAETSGVSPRFLTSLEGGHGNISVLRLQQVCDALSLPLHELFSPERNRGIITLLGLRGAGKTTLGRALAERHGLPFAELDILIEERSGMPLGEVFSLHGEEYFRRLERETLQVYLQEHRQGIVATGGGIVTHPPSMELLIQQTWTIWVSASPQEHMDRVLRQGDQRPMRGRANAMDELRALLRSREHLYQQAFTQISTSRKTVLEAIAELEARLFDCGALMKSEARNG